MQYPVKTMLLLLVCFSCTKKKSTRNDLTAYGLNGRVQAWKSTIYEKIHEHNGQWEPDSGAQPYAEENTYFNPQGNLTKKTYYTYSDGRSSETVYEYSGDVKRSWIKKDNYDELIERAEITAKGNTMTETIYNSDGMRQMVVIATLDDQNRIHTTESRIYSDKDELMMHLFITNTINDKGFIVRQTTWNKVDNNSEQIDNVILEMDKQQNPIKVLAKMDGEPHSIIKTQITYYE